MKKFITYFFIVTYLFSFSEVRQVMKIPNFVEHYVSHRLINSDTSLFSFVKMHYLDEHEVDSDYHQDMKLPFKTHEANTFVVNPLTIPENFGFAVKMPKLFREKTLIFSYSPDYASNPLASIFRPPILV